MRKAYTHRMDDRHHTVIYQDGSGNVKERVIMARNDGVFESREIGEPILVRSASTVEDAMAMLDDEVTRYIQGLT